MTLETIELDKKMLEYSISQFRTIPEYEKICEAFCVGLSSVQNAVNYLSNMIDIDSADGVWLDYIGWLVGIQREQAIDTSRYFCANAEDVNVSKFFYFPNVTTEGNSSDLGDELFRGQIKAKIAYNVSKGTREDLIRIIKPLVNADKVEITQYAPMLLDITVYGENLITTNITERINNILPNGVRTHGSITVIESIPYENIEPLINNIVEMDNISEIDPNYTYKDISDDLDEILEIENDEL